MQNRIKMNEICEKLIKISDFEYICRLCLEKGQTIKPILLKTEDDIDSSVNNNNIVKIIYAFTSIQIYPNDGLPRFLCEQCLEKLNSSYEFHKKCLHSDRILQKVRDAHDADMLRNMNIFNDNTIKLKPSDSLPVGKNSPRTLTEISRKNVDKQREENTNKKIIVDSETDEENFTLANLIKKSKINNRNINSVTTSGDKLVSDECLSSDMNDSIDRNDSGNLQSVSSEWSGSGDLKNKTKERIKYKNRRLTKEERLKTRKVCPVCGVLTYALSQHIMIHGEKNHKCEICGKAFAQRGTHKTHMYTHTGNKPYQCSLCDKKFCDSSSRKSHMVSHTGEKNYHCGICRKSFGYSHSLAAHRRTHTQDRKHACSYCGRLFLNNFQLKYHIRIHTGEKPYHCEICSKSFITSGHLGKHKHIHTRERIKCTMCEMEFVNRRGVNSHLKKVHSVIITKKKTNPETLK